MKGGDKCDGTDPLNIAGYRIGDYYIKECAYAGTFYVYKVCAPDSVNDRLTDCEELLVKVYQLHHWVTMKKVEFERDIMLKINDLNISPKFYGLHTITRNGKNYAMLLMEHYGGYDLENSGTLDGLLQKGVTKTEEKYIKEKIKHLLDTLYKNHYQYNDLHSNNFLYKKVNGQYEFKIIDFEEIKEIPLDKPVDKKYNIEIVSTGEFFDVSSSGGRKIRKTYKKLTKRNK